MEELELAGLFFGDFRPFSPFSVNYGGNMKLLMKMFRPKIVNLLRNFLGLPETLISYRMCPL